MSLKDKILKLAQGFPQDWIYIEREVVASLDSTKNEGVRAPFQFVGKNLSEIFKRDLLDVNSRKIAAIRPVIGPNGAGKSTQLELQVRKYLEKVFKDKHVYLFFDFKHITDVETEFWPILFSRIYDQIKDNHYLRDLCAALPPTKKKTNWR